MTDRDTMIPFCAHEAEMSRHEAGHTRDFIEKIILILLLVITNSCWLWYESQFEETTTMQEIEQQIETGDGDTSLNIIGVGDIYGESKAEY